MFVADVSEGKKSLFDLVERWLERTPFLEMVREIPLDNHSFRSYDGLGRTPRHAFSCIPTWSSALPTCICEPARRQSRGVCCDGCVSVQGDFQFWKSYEASVDHMLAQDEASLRWVLGPGPVAPVHSSTVPADPTRSSL